MRKLRKCFKYVKTEFPTKDLKKGDLYSFEPTDSEDNIDPNMIMQATEDAKPCMTGGTEVMAAVLKLDLDFPEVPDTRREQ